jgi:hypothetical protein
LRIKAKVALAFLGISLLPFGVASAFARCNVERPIEDCRLSVAVLPSHPGR